MSYFGSGRGAEGDSHGRRPADKCHNHYVVLLASKFGKMTGLIQRQGVHRKTWRLGLLVTLFMVAMAACAAAVPPRELLDRNDHEGLATWYEQEAVRLRGKAEEMSQMIERYSVFSCQLFPKESKTELIAHCRYFMDYYAKAAEEAETLAKLHREQDTTIP